MRRAVWMAAAVGVLLVLGEKKIGMEKNPSSRTKPGEWFLVRLTEYHPDAPPSEVKREGGPRDRYSQPVKTIEEYREGKSGYVSVSADLVLQGVKVPYGARLYLDGWPGVVFRVVDTGKNFRGEGKKIREEGHEPLDIATKWSGPHLEFNGRLTRARIDYQDTLPKREQRMA